MPFNLCTCSVHLLYDPTVVFGIAELKGDFNIFQWKCLSNARNTCLPSTCWAVDLQWRGSWDSLGLGKHCLLVSIPTHGVLFYDLLICNVYVIFYHFRYTIYIFLTHMHLSYVLYMVHMVQVFSM